MDVLLAAAFLGVITITLFPTVAFLMRRSTITQGTVEANLLVQEGIEIAYNAYAINWTAYDVGTYVTAFDNNTKTYILDPLIPGVNDDPLEAKYTRTITVENVSRTGAPEWKQDPTGTVDPKSKKITTTVQWKQGETTVSQQASLLLYEF